MSTNPLKLVIRNVSKTVAHVKNRLAFHFGVITLTQADLVTVAITAEAANGQTATGFASDFLVPR